VQADLYARTSGYLLQLTMTSAVVVSRGEVLAEINHAGKWISSSIRATAQRSGKLPRR